jgi:hypothetical protein
MQQSLQHKEGSFDPVPNGAHGPDADGYPSRQGGSLGRLHALQAERSGRDELSQPQSQDPNFRQLSRAPIVNRPLPDGGLATPRLPTASSLRLRGKGIPIPLAPIPPTSQPPISMPAIPEWWKTFGTILRVDSFPDMVRDGEGDEHRRCVRAAYGSNSDWDEFCKYLDFGWNKTVGGETQNRGCWSKTNESNANRKLWCDLQFGDD